MLHAADIISTVKHIVENDRQLMPLAGVADLEPGDLRGTSSNPLLRVPLEAILSDTPAPTPFLVTLAHNTSLSQAQLPLLPWTRISFCSHHSA